MRKMLHFFGVHSWRPAPADPFTRTSDGAVQVEHCRYCPAVRWVDAPQPCMRDASTGEGWL